MTPAARAARPGRAPAVVAALVLAALYAPTLRDLVLAWHDVSYHTYGFVIAPFSGWLAWEARRELGGAPFAAWRPGFALLAGGLAVLALGALGGSLFLRGLSIPLVVAGAGLFALGPRRFRPLAFPVGFLAFMAPLPPAVLAALSLPLQHLAAVVTAPVLDALGIPATRTGLLIHLPRVSLEITEGCNGLRFLLAMLVVGVAFGALTQRTFRARVVVLVSALGVGLVANLVRVTGTGVVAHVFGPDAASGVPHLLFGKVVYLALMAPFIGVIALHRRGRAPLPRADRARAR